MKEKRKAAEAAHVSNNTKVQNPKDFARLMHYFRYKTATSLDAMFDTGILRNSITWYIDGAERMGLLQAVFKAKDSHTRRLAKHYSSDPAKWPKSPLNKKSDLAREEV